MSKESKVTNLKKMVEILETKIEKLKTQKEIYELKIKILEKETFSSSKDSNE